MNKCLQITALLLGFGVSFAAFAALPAPKPPKAVVYADQPLPAATKSQAETEPLPSPLTTGERVVVGLDPKEDFIILGKDEPDPVAPEPPAPEAEKSMLPLVDALGLGHTEPPPIKAPVSVSSGIVPPGPVLTPIVMVAGPNIGAKPALPEKRVKKAGANVVLKKAVTVVLKPAQAPLPTVKVILEKPTKPQPIVLAKKIARKPIPAKEKTIRNRPANPGPVNPNPVRKRTALIEPIKPIKLLTPSRVVHHASLVKPIVKPAVVFKPVIKTFVPIRHAVNVPVKPAPKKVKVATVAPKPIAKKMKTAAKHFIFKPVIKPYVKA